MKTSVYPIPTLGLVHFALYMFHRESFKTVSLLSVLVALDSLSQPSTKTTCTSFLGRL